MFSLCKHNVPAPCHTLFMGGNEEPTDPVWTRINDELERRKDKRLLPASWAELARKLHATEQKLNNWRRRRVPPAAFGDIADALGWTVDQVAGRDAPPKPSAAIADVADQMLSLMTVFGRLTEVQRQKVIEFALSQQKASPKLREANSTPKLTPDDPSPTRHRTPRQDQGAISTTPLSESSAAQSRRARK